MYKFVYIFSFKFPFLQASLQAFLKFINNQGHYKKKIALCNNNKSNDS